ncbi:unnamed protein product [Orchesella dallaii]|uniref:Transient receptor potential channel pyrexia n=1 Tax=Orchesella dallaii TaxID=48710 RepID=A0ABP1RIR9_9HEXA
MTSANEPELIEVMTINDGPAYTEELSEFVKNGDYNKLRKYLDNTPATILNSFNEEGRSPLHDACDCGTNKKLASKLVSLILLWYSRHKKYDGDDVNKNIFIDKKDGLGNTALHYAVEHRNREAVKELLACGADVNIKNDNEEEAITSIYEHFPETIISLLNGPTSIQFVEDEDDPSDRRMKVKCNFGVITGIDNDPREVYETNMLSNVFRLDKETRVEILLNPIVQLFIDLKWSKMKKLIYISMAFHIIWSLLSSIFIMDMFMKTFGNNTKETFEALENSKGNPYFNSDNEYRIWTLFIYTAIVMVKEGFEIWFTPKYGTYGTQFENIGQWILIIFIYVLFLLGKFLPVWSGFLMSIVRNGFIHRIQNIFKSISNLKIFYVGICLYSMGFSSRSVEQASRTGSLYGNADESVKKIYVFFYLLLSNFNCFQLRFQNDYAIRGTILRDTTFGNCQNCCDVNR